jgi:drug/metabolite transporter (DMT)-like permease
MAGSDAAARPGGSAPGRLTVFLVLSVALFAVGHAAIFVRLADAHPFTVAAYRLGIATLVLLPFALPALRRVLPSFDRRRWALLAGAMAFLAVHFATWIASLDYTSIANSVVLVTLTPVWLALWSVVVLRVVPGAATLAAVALAILGTAVIGWGSFRLGGDTLFGDLLALVGGATFAGYLLFAQSLRRDLDLLPFAALVYGGAALLLWALVLALGLPVSGFDGTTWAAMAALALISQIVGHSGFNWAVKSVAPTFIALTILLEPPLSALLGWFWFGERLTPETAVGGALALAAIWLGSRGGAARASRPADGETA